jgi:hypothetical protein
VEDAKKVAEQVIAKAIAQQNPNALRQVAALLRLGSGKSSKELMAVAIKAAEAAVKVSGEDDAQTLIELASTYSVAGDKAMAKQYAKKAVAAAGESTALKMRILEQRENSARLNKQMTGHFIDQLIPQKDSNFGPLALGYDSAAG